MTDRSVGGTSTDPGHVENLIWRCAESADRRGNPETFCDRDIIKTNYLFFENGENFGL